LLQQQNSNVTAIIELGSLLEVANFDLFWTKRREKSVTTLCGAIPEFDDAIIKCESSHHVCLLCGGICLCFI
jgi:hypothetical protein